MRTDQQDTRRRRQTSGEPALYMPGSWTPPESRVGETGFLLVKPCSLSHHTCPRKCATHRQNVLQDSSKPLTTPTQQEASNPRIMISSTCSPFRPCPGAPLCSFTWAYDHAVWGSMTTSPSQGKGHRLLNYMQQPRGTSLSECSSDNTPLPSIQTRHAWEWRAGLLPGACMLSLQK